jgi:hypothetical protein
MLCFEIAVTITRAAEATKANNPLTIRFIDVLLLFKGNRPKLGLLALAYGLRARSASVHTLGLSSFAPLPIP